MTEKIICEDCLLNLCPSCCERVLEQGRIIKVEEKLLDRQLLECSINSFDRGFRQGQIKAYKKCLEIIENQYFRIECKESTKELKEEIKKEIEKLEN